MKRFLKWGAAMPAVLAVGVAGFIGFLEFVKPAYLSRTLTAEQARSLLEDAQGDARLSLWRLTSLTPEAAAVLAEYEGEQMVFMRL